MASNWISLKLDSRLVFLSSFSLRDEQDLCVPGQMSGRFLHDLAWTDKLSIWGTNPKVYWRRAQLLFNIQQGGNGQKEILGMFGCSVLQEEFAVLVSIKSVSADEDFIHLDDCIGNGQTSMRNDVCNWLQEDTRQNIHGGIITPVLFTGSWWMDGKIKKAANENGKAVVITKWHPKERENRLAYRNRSDVLWPTSIPDQEVARQYCAYLEELSYPPILRNAGHPGDSGIFKDDAQKILMEKEFLVRGCHIWTEQANLPERLRPLGYNNLHSLGFGSMFVTYRNCPNNCPLVFWVEQNDFPPLFPRKTNTATSNQDLF